MLSVVPILNVAGKLDAPAPEAHVHATLGNALAAPSNSLAFWPIKPLRIVDQKLALKSVGQSNQRNDINDQAIVGNVVLHVRMRPIGPPKDAIGIILNQRPY